MGIGDWRFSLQHSVVQLSSKMTNLTKFNRIYNIHTKCLKLRFCAASAWCIYDQVTISTLCVKC